MEHPWGISGPEFLWLYAAGLAVALAWLIVTRTRARRPRQIEPTPPLDLESVAFLSGGSRRVIELAIGRLLEAGALRANRSGTISAVKGSQGNDPVEAAVLGAVAARSRQVRTVISSIRSSERIERIADELAAHQLVVTPRVAASARRKAVLGLVLVLVIGAVRFVNGAVKSLPVSYLAFELIATLALIVILLKRPIRARTVHGDRALESARTTIADGLGLVALFGLAMFPNEAVRSALSAGGKARVSSGSSSSWSYAPGVYIASCGGSTSSGGSSCGSSGGSSCGGGGGGGGCGGGGGG